MDMRLPAEPPDAHDLLQQLMRDPERFMQVMTTSFDTSGYPHWDTLRRKPAPAGLTSEEWWLRIKTARGQTARGMA